MTISAAPASASSESGEPGHPQVLAHREADPRLAEVEHRAPVAGLEVALLVGHAVVPQPRLAVDRADLAAGDHRDRVEDVLRALREADHGDDPVHVAGDRLERLARVAQEVLLEQQVLGRVAGDGQLGREHELGAAVARGLDRAGDPRGVALHVADDAVELGEREAERGQRTGHGSHVGSSATRARRGRSRPRRTRAGAGRRGRRCGAGAARRPRSTAPGAVAAGEDDLLAGGRDLGVERPADVALQRPQRGGRALGVVEDDHVAELERVQDLVRAQPALARRQPVVVGAARRRVGEALQRHVLAGVEVPRAEVGLQLPGPRGGVRAADAGVVARVEGQQQREDAAGHQHGAEQEGQQPPH